MRGYQGLQAPAVRPRWAIQRTTGRSICRERDCAHHDFSRLRTVSVVPGPRGIRLMRQYVPRAVSAPADSSVRALQSSGQVVPRFEPVLYPSWHPYQSMRQRTKARGQSLGLQFARSLHMLGATDRVSREPTLHDVLDTPYVPPGTADGGSGQRRLVEIPDRGGLREQEDDAYLMAPSALR